MISSSPPEHDYPSDAPPSRPPSLIRSSRATRWVTGTAGKAFLVIMLALLPLAVATMITNWRSIQVAEKEKAELLQTAARQNAMQLTSDINAIRTAQALTANVMASDSDPGQICDRLQHLFNAMTGSQGIVVAIFERTGKIRCHSMEATERLMAALHEMSRAADLILAPGLDGLLIRSTSNKGEIVAISLYRRPALRKLTGVFGSELSRSIVLRQDGRELALAEASAVTGSGAKRVSAEAPVAGTNLTLNMGITDSTSPGAHIFPLVMPLLLWVAAVFLGWLVVRWILIKPLIALRREVSAYMPGQVIQPPRISRLTSGEIVELGESFRAMSEDVAEHEEEMRSALARQMKLTREVHHRVKNNLQIISSLISLHWRAATDPKAANAYLSIQRRVDALAIVQRNHYAELDEARGVRARSMMNEIAYSLKISAQVQSGRTIDIAVDCDDVMLHQDVAAPIAFMTAELADLVIDMTPGGRFTICLIRLEDDATRARFSLMAPLFRQSRPQQTGTVEHYERVLDGLARQLRTPLGHDPERGEYYVTVATTG